MSGVTAEHAVSVRLGEDAAAVHAARQALAGLCGQLDTTLLEDMRLLVSELVTNSIKHSQASGSGVSLDVLVSGDQVRIEVADGGAGFDPAPRRLDQDEASGWGLFLVDCLVDRWGVVRGDGTRVWVEIDRPRHAS